MEHGTSEKGPMNNDCNITFGCKSYVQKRLHAVDNTSLLSCLLIIRAQIPF